MRKLKKEELNKYKDYLTVGKLKKFLNKHDLSDDALILIQRVEDVYYEKHGWGVYLKEGYNSKLAREHNIKIKGEYLDKEQYPNIIEKDLKQLSEEDIEETMEQYTPAFSCVRYKDENDILFIDLHY